MPFLCLLNFMGTEYFVSSLRSGVNPRKRVVAANSFPEASEVLSSYTYKK
jgi:hypothetical protein